jgi:4-hydroxy-tetrahydrodipicolinate synthase
MILNGCGTALVTPFRHDGGVDEAALEALVEWQIVQGIDFLIPCGTTGEASTLTEAETLRVVEIVCRVAAGRVPVFAGCTHNATHEAMTRARKLAAVPGLTGILTANPYYNRPNQEGQYQHFKAIAESVELPVLLYNIPGRTGANLEPATVLRLASIPNVIGIKESSGNMAQITELLQIVPKNFLVFSGDDGLVLPTMALGAVGLISVASNVVPGVMHTLVASILANDWVGARRLNRQYTRLMQALFLEPSPAPAKAVLEMLGKGQNVLRLPLVQVSKGTLRTLETVAGELGLLVNVPSKETNLRVF